MKKAMLLWVDLEMTGLDPVKDRILEVAAIATDMQLNEIARYEAVVKVDEKIIKSRMVGEFWEKNSATRDAHRHPFGYPILYQRYRITNLPRLLVPSYGRSGSRKSKAAVQNRSCGI